jgi:hypothetical protein
MAEGTGGQNEGYQLCGGHCGIVVTQISAGQA